MMLLAVNCNNVSNRLEVEDYSATENKATSSKPNSKYLKRDSNSTRWWLWFQWNDSVASFKNSAYNYPEVMFYSFSHCPMDTVASREFYFICSLDKEQENGLHWNSNFNAIYHKALLSLHLRLKRFKNHSVCICFPFFFYQRFPHVLWLHAHTLTHKTLILACTSRS